MGSCDLVTDHIYRAKICLFHITGTGHDRFYMVMLTKCTARCLVLQFSGINSFRRVNGQVYLFDDRGYGLGGFVERSVRGLGYRGNC